jgi:peptide deformylase
MIIDWHTLPQFNNQNHPSCDPLLTPSCRINNGQTRHSALSRARLHTVAKPVAVVDAHPQTDRRHGRTIRGPRIGLAATQVNVHERVIVIDISETHDALRVLINPEIIAQLGREESEEGCLSVPGVFDKVQRAECVTVRALDREGKPFELKADGLLAVCIQHEMDHLIGKVFVDYLSNLKRNRIKAKLAKQAREHRPDATPVRASL